MTDQFFPQSLADMPKPAELAGLTGLEIMQGVVEGRFPAAPIAKVMNFRFQSVKKGEVIFRGSPKFDHFNPMGTVHGGWYGTLLDSALGCTVATMLPAGKAYTTLEYKVNLTRGLREGTLVDCTARIQHMGRSTAVAEGEIRGVEDGKLYATGSTTCIILSL